MSFKKSIIVFILIFISVSIFKSCKQNYNDKKDTELEYSDQQKNEFNKIISTIIITEQNQFPQILVFKTPKKLYLAKNTNLFTDSISLDYLRTNNLFKDSTFDEIRNQNDYKLQDLNKIIRNINLSNSDSTGGTFTKIIYVPFINSDKDNAFLRISTLDSGHFLDSIDYWLKKENRKWKIVEEKMIMVH